MDTLTRMDLPRLLEEVQRSIDNGPRTPTLYKERRAVKLRFRKRRQGDRIVVAPLGFPLCEGSGTTLSEAKAAARKKVTQYLRHYPPNEPVPMVPTDWDPDELLKFRDEWLRDA